MARKIAITSGKGGVGKTTLAINLGLALAEFDKKVIIVDADIRMANISLMLGKKGTPISLQDVLIGQADVEDALYEINENTMYMPAALSEENIEEIDGKKFKKIIDTISPNADIILIDTAPGVEESTLAALNSSDEAMIVTMPEPSAVTDSMKMAVIAERKLGLDILGTVVNMKKGMRKEMDNEEIRKTVQTDVLATISEDSETRESTMKGEPIVLTNPQNPAAKAIIGLAADLLDEEPPERIKKPKETKGIIKRIKELLNL